MRYIKHISKADWGTCFLFMEEKGRAFARAYVFNDDDKSIYLDWLSVDEDFRNKGAGLRLQKIREDLGKKTGCKYSYLWVKKGTWQRKWYARRGYKYFKPKKSEDAIWLRKKLNDN